VPDFIKIQYTVTQSKIQASQTTVKQFIWNNQTSAWEEGDYTAYNMDQDRIAKYVDKNNKIKLKYEMDEGNVQLPQITVEGSVK